MGGRNFSWKIDTQKDNVYTHANVSMLSDYVKVTERCYWEKKRVKFKFILKWGFTDGQSYSSKLRDTAIAWFNRFFCVLFFLRIADGVTVQQQYSAIVDPFIDFSSNEKNTPTFKGARFFKNIF